MVVVGSPAPRLRLHETVGRQLTVAIVSGTLPSDAPLPTESELGEQFGVSRMVIREAMRVLVTKGLVRVEHGNGTYVNPPDSWDPLDALVLQARLESGTLADVLGDVLEVRRMVEVEVASLAALRRHAKHLHLLAQACDAMRARLDDPEGYTAWDDTFHDTLLDAAANRLLRRLLAPLRQLLSAGRLFTLRRPGAPQVSLAGHRAILAAVAAGDTRSAGEAMRAHVTQFADDLRERMLAHHAPEASHPARLS